MPEVLESIPSHVPPELVVDFDFANLPGSGDDVHLAWKALQAKVPDIFWTPHYGGHWVAMRADAVEEIQKDHEHFSHKEFALPRGVKPFRFAPLEYDPPFHADYRKLINPAFSPTVIARLEKEARALAIKLIDDLKPKGHCEFIADFAHHLPITIFLSMVDLPLEDRDYCLSLAEISVRNPDRAVKQKAFKDTVLYLKKFIDERTKNPGTDLISQVVQGKVNGRPMEEDEVLGMCSVLFFGGLDTVASSMGFVMRYLAEHPQHRQQLVDHPELIPNAVEEFFRRFGLSNTMRVLTEDYVFKGAPLKKDEMIMVPISMHGLDDRRWGNGEEVDFNRKDVFKMATFGNGPHRCPGSNLARTEIRLLLEEWLKRIPDFGITPGDKARTQSGSVNGVIYLPLSWKV